MSTPASGADPTAPTVVEADILDTPEAGRRVMVGGAVRIGGYGLGLIASVLAARVLFEYMGAVDYGRFSTVIALVSGLQVLTDLGMASLGVREYSQRTGEDRDRFMRVLLGMRLVTTVLLLTTTAIAALLLGYDADMVIGAVLMGIAVSIGAFSGTVATPLYAAIRMGVVTGIDVGRQVATAIGYVILAAVGAGLVAFLGITIPVSIGMLAVTFMLVRGSVPLRPILAPSAWRDLVMPTLTFALATAAGSLYVYGAMVLTELVVSEVETGMFGAAFRVYIILAAFPALLVSTAFPVLSRAARDDRERLRYAAQRLVESSALLGGAAIVGLVLGAEPVILAIATDKFADAIPLLRIQGIALALTFVIATFGFTLMALHRHRAIIVCNLAALAVSGTTVLLLGSSYGAEGASYGVLLGETTLLASYVIALRLGDDPIHIDFRRVALLVPPLAVALCCWFLPIPAVAQTVVGLAVYGAGLVVMRAIPDELVAVLPPSVVSRLRSRSE